MKSMENGLVLDSPSRNSMEHRNGIDPQNSESESIRADRFLAAFLGRLAADIRSGDFPTRASHALILEDDLSLGEILAVTGMSAKSASMELEDLVTRGAVAERHMANRTFYTLALSPTS